MYSEPAGTRELREAVLRWLDVDDRYGPENVVISTGPNQCLFNIFLAVCNPADCVLFDAAPGELLAPRDGGVCLSRHGAAARGEAHTAEGHPRRSALEPEGPHAREAPPAQQPRQSHTQV